MGKRHRHREILPAPLQGNPTETLLGPNRQQRQKLEIFRRRRAGEKTLGRLPRRLPIGDRGHREQKQPVAHSPRRQKMVHASGDLKRAALRNEKTRPAIPCRDKRAGRGARREQKQTNGDGVTASPPRGGSALPPCRT